MKINWKLMVLGIILSGMWSFFNVVLRYDGNFGDFLEVFIASYILIILYEIISRRLK